MPRIARPAGLGARRPISPWPMTLFRYRRTAPRRSGAIAASMWRWDAFLPASAAEAVTPGRGQHAAPGRAVARSRRRLDQGRIAQSDLVIQGPAGLVGASPWPGASAPRSIASSSSGNAGASAAAYAAKAGLPCVVFTFTAPRRPLVTQMRAYGAMVVRSRTRTTAGGCSRPASRVRLVSDLAVLRPGGRQQSLWHGRLQDDRLRDRRGLRLAAARLVRAAGVLRRRAVRHVEGLRGAEGARLDRPHAAASSPPRSRARSPRRWRGGDADAAQRPRNTTSIATSIGASRAPCRRSTCCGEVKGAAVTVGDDDLRRWVVTLGAREGIWPEPSSAAPFAAIERLRRRARSSRDERCVALMTASGLKDHGADREDTARAPVVAGRSDDVLHALKNSTVSPMAELGIAMDGRAPIADIPAQARRRRRAAPRRCGSPAISSCAIRSRLRRSRSAPRRASRSR